ncbi:MAG: hypothetical protein AB7S74_05055 [Hyphomicrobium sp.]
MEEEGAVEVQVFSDIGRVGDGEPNYTAQLLEIEYGVTDLFTTAVYLEGAKTFDSGDGYDFGSFRFENRLRLFREETLLNPVLYAEYIYKRPNSRFVKDVVGRVDGEEEEEEEEEGSEHELETKIILGHDINSKLNVAFNTIHEVNLENGHWAFGYAAGLNYEFFRAYDAPPSLSYLSERGIQKLTLGLELFGGAGDSTMGLTLDGSKTEQYIGIGLRADLKNEIHVGIGGSFGLTGHSEDAIFRIKAGIEFE